MRGPDGPMRELRDVGGGEEGGVWESGYVELFEGAFAVGVGVEDGGGGGRLRGRGAAVGGGAFAFVRGHFGVNVEVEWVLRL